MKFSLAKLPWGWVRLAAAVILIGAAAVTFNMWWPSLSAWIDSTVAAGRGQAPPAEGGDHAPNSAHDDTAHEHAGHEHPHEEATSLELSEQARRNLGLNAGSIQPVQLQTYWRTITVPALVVNRPGRTQLEVSTPMTGVVTSIQAVTGQAVAPGKLLFEIRLTHEDLVQSQTEFLKTLGELDVELREIKRLEEVAASGAIPAKTLLERQYAKDKLDAILVAQREALRLHGLSERQIEDIVKQRRLLRELQVYCPVPGQADETKELQLTESEFRPAVLVRQRYNDPETTPLVLEQLDVQKGQMVSAGKRLCMLADYSQLYIEGRAFDQDGRAVTEALQRDWPVQAVFEDRGSAEGVLGGLKMAFVANTVEPQSRTLSFYVDLPNEIVNDETSSEGQRFVTWRYRPGQRLQLRVPVEQWQDRIVLPIDAVIKEGAEYFIFQENGGHFDRVPVHVEYRDQQSAVIANDGSIFPGDRIALRNAHQMQMALKNKAGGGAGAHGHMH